MSKLSEPEPGERIHQSCGVACPQVKPSGPAGHVRLQPDCATPTRYLCGNSRSRGQLSLASLSSSQNLVLLRAIRCHPPYDDRLIKMLSTTRRNHYVFVASLCRARSQSTALLERIEPDMTLIKVCNDFSSTLNDANVYRLMRFVFTNWWSELEFNQTVQFGYRSPEKTAQVDEYIFSAETDEAIGPAPLCDSPLHRKLRTINFPLMHVDYLLRLTRMALPFLKTRRRWKGM